MADKDYNFLSVKYDFEKFHKPSSIKRIKVEKLECEVDEVVYYQTKRGVYHAYDLKSGMRITRSNDYDLLVKGVNGMKELVVPARETRRYKLTCEIFEKALAEKGIRRKGEKRWNAT